MPPRIDYSRNIRLLLRESSGRINGAHEWTSFDARAQVCVGEKKIRETSSLLLEAKQKEKSLYTPTQRGGRACFFFDYIISILHNDKF